MLKSVIIFSVFLTCCYCLEGNDLSVFEARAKKKKSSIKLLGLILLFVFSKMAIFKAVSVFLMMTFFQKLFSFGGLVFQYFMKMKAEKSKPAPLYGAPPTQNYDTVGYSYGPPEHEPLHQEGYPGKNVAVSLDWLLNKHAN
ncbi:jg2058 [Pararge aegeria aegeria]|uniref:Jg2058 protein n=1 Tax=Pararge aegeria aegeria TaxID=348720 RepID=A0A8S4RF80_9NEOP|nr:jg2058 [Pararge aegeria aegeria]